jgi:hypothetical protein
MPTAITNTAIQLKKSGSSGNTPADLNYGELALNYADGKIFYKNWLNSIDYITNQDTFSTINANSSLVIASTDSDVLSLQPGSGIQIDANVSTKTITVKSDAAHSADIYANGAFSQANAAYSLANTLSSGSVDNYARPHSNAAFNRANSSVLKTGDTMTGDLLINTANIEVNYIIVENTLYSGLASRSSTPLPNLIAQFTSNASSYVQVNAQNIDPNGSADYVITADVGTDETFYVDLGLHSSQFTEGTIYPLDGYLYVQGNTSQLGGNLIIGTTSDTPGIQTRIVAGGYDEQNVVITIDPDFTTIKNKLTVNASLSVNTSTLTSISYTSSNTNQVVVDRFLTSEFRSAKYDVQLTNGSNYHVFEVRVLQDGSSAFITQYGEIFTSTRLGNVDASCSGGYLNLLFQPDASPTTIKLLRTAIAT